MRTSKYLKLHSRCTTCLEMIQMATNAVNNNQRSLDVLNAEKWKNWEYIRDCENRLAKYTRVRERLIRYYSDIFERLQSETHEFRTPDWLKDIDKVNIGTLQDEAPNALSEFNTEMDAEEENEILADVLGGIKY